MTRLESLQLPLRTESDVMMTLTLANQLVHATFFDNEWFVVIYDEYTDSTSGVCTFTNEEWAAISNLALFGENGIEFIEAQRSTAENALTREGVIDGPFRLIP